MNPSNKLRPILIAALAALLAWPRSARSAAEGAAAPGASAGALPTPARLGQAIQAHFNSVDPTAAESFDVRQLMAAIDANIGQTDTGEGKSERVKRLVSGLAIIGALSDPQQLSGLQAYLGASKTGRQAASQVKDWAEQVQKDPQLQEELKKRHEAFATEIKMLSGIDEAGLKKLFDGGARAVEETVASVAPVVAQTEAASGEQAAARLAPAVPRLQTKPQEVPAPVRASDALSSLAFGAPKTAEAKPVVAKPVKFKINSEEARVTAYVDALLRLDPEDVRQRQQGRGAARTWGKKDQEAAAAQAIVLQKPLAKFTRLRDNQSEIDQALEALKTQVDLLDPKKVNFSPGRWRRVMARVVPGIKLPAQKYASNYEGAQNAVKEIIGALERGRNELLQDNERLLETQNLMRGMTRQLQKDIDFAKLINAELDKRLNDEDSEIAAERREFLKDEVLFPFKQRVIDLQTQLAVNQQGVLATGIMIKNNEILANNVDRTINVIPPALQVAIDIALGLGRQRSVSEGLANTNKTGGELIARNAEGISEQALTIQQQAVEGALPVDTLKSAFDKLRGTLDQISGFRNRALPQLENEIKKLDELTRQSEEAMTRVEGVMTEPQPSQPGR